MVKAKKRELYVEGGGDKNPSLASECRRAFSKLFERAGVVQRPKVIACGGRRRAYDQFCIAHDEAKADVWLLVDAESLAPVGPPFDPWEHVRTQPGDGWERPPGANAEHLQLMNVCMETWLIADHEAVREVFGPKLDESKLPPEGPSLEERDKPMIYGALAAATRGTPSGEYSKGSHAFKVLAEVSPDKLRALSWAGRFLDEIRDVAAG
jgi:hypothetical protein